MDQIYQVKKKSKEDEIEKKNLILYIILNTKSNNQMNKD
jgi:hypothetical protein